MSETEVKNEEIGPEYPRDGEVWGSWKFDEATLTLRHPKLHPVSVGELNTSSQILSKLLWLQEFAEERYIDSSGVTDFLAAVNWLLYPEENILLVGPKFNLIRDKPFNAVDHVRYEVCMAWVPPARKREPERAA